MKHEQKHASKSKRNSRHLVIIIVAVTVSVLIMAGAVIFALLWFSNKDKPATPTQSTAAVSAPTTAAPSQKPSAVFSLETEAETQPPTDAAAEEVEMDDELSELLSSQGIDEDDIKELSSSQIVTVSSYGNSASVNFWEIKDHKWTKDESLSASGFVGEMGATDDMSEYVKATPRGFFPVMDAFYINEKPQTGLDSFQITGDTYWVDDPSSDFYNQRVEGTQYQDWSSAEHMIDYTSSYEYGFVIGYNLACVKGAGSAIFFHVGSGPTAGCVAVSRSEVLAYLSKLSSDANPFILIN